MGFWGGSTHPGCEHSHGAGGARSESARNVEIRSVQIGSAGARSVEESHKNRSLKIDAKNHRKICDFWSKMEAQIDPKIDAKIDAKKSLSFLPLLKSAHLPIGSNFFTTPPRTPPHCFLYCYRKRSAALRCPPTRFPSSADPLRAVERARVQLLNTIYIYYMHIY